MVVQRHGVGDDLKAVVQGAVVLAVDPLRTVVDQGHQGLGGADALTAFVDLQLHAEVAGTGAIEDGLGLVVIALDAAGDSIAVVAGVTQWFILFLVSGLIVGIRQGDQSAAMVAAGVVEVIAVLTEGCFRGSGIVVPPKTAAAVGTADGFRIQAAWAEGLAVEVDAVGFRDGLSAGFTEGAIGVHKQVAPFQIESPAKTSQMPLRGFLL